MYTYGWKDVCIRVLFSAKFGGDRAYLGVYCVPIGCQDTASVAAEEKAAGRQSNL